ncbi:hypothetical protein E7Z54_11015 [Nocardioides sp.]|nr:hypothetical protein E7Z54_11015 [Nocardioides sp.]
MISYTVAAEAGPATAPRPVTATSNEITMIVHRRSSDLAAAVVRLGGAGMRVMTTSLLGGMESRNNTCEDPPGDDALHPAAVPARSPEVERIWSGSWSAAGPPLVPRGPGGGSTAQNGFLVVQLADLLTDNAVSWRLAAHPSPARSRATEEVSAV